MPPTPTLTSLPPPLNPPSAVDAPTDVRGRLDEITRLLGVADRAIAAVVGLLAGIDQRAVIAEEGQTVRSWLRLVAGCTGSDERTLLLAAQRLVHLPAVRAWLADGTITWAVARSIVFATRRLTIAQLGWLDETLTGDAQRLARLDADGVIAAVERLAADARPDLEADRERRLFERRYAQVQTGLDGSVQLYAEFDAEMGAAVLDALETTPVTTSSSTQPSTDTTNNGDEAADSDGTDAAGDPTPDPVPDRTRGQRRADALYALCLQRTTSRASDGAPSANGNTAGSAPAPARPSLLVLADIATLVGDGAPRVEHTAELLWRSTRGPVRLTAGALERIACHGDLRLIFTDGGVPLGVTEPTPNVGAPLRAAVIARDGTCRFPACREAAGRCDVHHVVPRHRDGATVLANLALLCPAHHRAVHEGGWHATLHPDGAMTFRRRGRQLTTVAFAHQRAAPSRPPPPGRPRRANTTDSQPQHQPAATEPTREPPHTADLPF